LSAVLLYRKKLGTTSNHIVTQGHHHMRVAVVGAGIYGSTIGILLAENGHDVSLFDRLGLLRATSSINQLRIHSGYHYPRSPETIDETLQARMEFQETYEAAVVKNTQHYYAIPQHGSRTPPDVFEAVMDRFRLPLKIVEPKWIDFDFIARCYEVNEQIYDVDVLRSIIEQRIRHLNIRFLQEEFTPQESDFEIVVWATYGLSHSQGIFRPAKYQIAEKVLIELPVQLRGISLVIIDGPFTAFDPYGNSSYSQFGSAKHTNHWTTTDPHELKLPRFANLLNQREFQLVDFSRFEVLRADSSLAVPASKEAKYLGSRFTIRVVENSPADDRRTLYVLEPNPSEIHIFSGKVVGAVKAANMVLERLSSRA
jgi:hypothetical protein